MQTLLGIFTVCVLVQDGLLDDADANDNHQVIDLVDLACSSRIGEYRDLMTRRANELYLACNVSLADVLTVHLQSKGTVF